MESKDFPSVIAEANEAGLNAGNALVPEPMTVVGGREKYHVPEGVCGFAWVTVRPGTTSFARYWKQNHRARRAYYGDVELWVRDFGQSHDRKLAYAEAYATKLREHGIHATAGSRLD